MAASPDSGPTGADGDLWKPVLVPVINHAGSFVVTPVFEATTTNRDVLAVLQIEAEMEEEAKWTGGNSGAPDDDDDVPTPFKIDELVCVRDDARGGRWHRGKVKDLLRYQTGRAANVVLVDRGRKLERISTDRLRKMEGGWGDAVEPLAKDFTLFGLKPLAPETFVGGKSIVRNQISAAWMPKATSVIRDIVESADGAFIRMVEWDRRPPPFYGHMRVRVGSPRHRARLVNKHPALEWYFRDGQETLDLGKVLLEGEFCLFMGEDAHRTFKKRHMFKSNIREPQTRSRDAFATRFTKEVPAGPPPSAEGKKGKKDDADTLFNSDSDEEYLSALDAENEAHIARNTSEENAALVQRFTVGHKGEGGAPHHGPRPHHGDQHHPHVQPHNGPQPHHDVQHPHAAIGPGLYHRTPRDAGRGRGAGMKSRPESVKEPPRPGGGLSHGEYPKWRSEKTASWVVPDGTDRGEPSKVRTTHKPLQDLPEMKNCRHSPVAQQVTKSSGSALLNKLRMKKAAKASSESDSACEVSSARKEARIDSNVPVGDPLPRKREPKKRDQEVSDLLLHQDPRGRAVRPVNSVFDIDNLHPALAKFLKVQQVDAPKPLQRGMWPCLSRCKSFVAIARQNGGKTVGFILPLINSLLTVDDYPAETEAPLAVIVCPNWKKCVEMDHTVQAIFADIPDAVPNDKRRLTARCIYEQEKRMQPAILNGAHVLIATPTSLLRIVAEFQYTNLDRCCHLIFDDADQTFETHDSEVAAIMTIYKAVHLAHKDLIDQVVVTANAWTGSIRSFMSKFLMSSPEGKKTGPAIGISSMLDAAVYGKIRNVATVVKSEDERLSRVKDIARSASESEMVLVFCSGAESATAVSKTVENSFLVHERMEKRLRESTMERWLEQTRSPFRPLVMSDFDQMKTNAMARCIVHFDVPRSRNCFNARFTHLTHSLGSVYERERQPPQPAVSHLIMSAGDAEALNTIYHFLRQYEPSQPIPEDVRGLYLEHQLRLAERKMGRDLCRDLKTAGRCRNKRTCQSRHFLHPDSDRTSAAVPTGAEVRFDLVRMKSPVHFVGRFRAIKHGAGGGIVEWDRSDLARKLTDLREKSLRRVTLDHHVGRTYLARGPHLSFRRAQLLSAEDVSSRVVTEDSIDNDSCASDDHRRRLATRPQRFNIKLLFVDEGHVEEGTNLDLWALPDDLTEAEFPRGSCEVVVVGLLPKDKDPEWSRASVDYVRRRLFPNLIPGALDKFAHLDDTGPLGSSDPEDPNELLCRARILLSARNTVFVSTVKVMERARKLSSWHMSFDLRKGLLHEEDVAVQNPHHFEELKRLCEKASIKYHLEEHNTTVVSHVEASKIVEIVERTAFLEDGLEFVHITEVYSPDHFYVQRAKFRPQLRSLEADMEKREMVRPESEEAIAVGGVYLADCRDTEDAGIFRVKIMDAYRGSLDVDNVGKIFAFLVDYGFEREIDREKIFEIPPEFVSVLPFQAIKCALFNLRATADPSGAEEAGDLLFNLGSGTDPEIDVMNMGVVPKSADEEEEKTFLVSIQGGRFEHELVQKNLAEYVDDNMALFDEEQHAEQEDRLRNMLEDMETAQGSSEGSQEGCQEGSQEGCHEVKAHSKAQKEGNPSTTTSSIYVPPSLTNPDRPKDLPALAAVEGVTPLARRSPPSSVRWHQDRTKKLVLKVDLDLNFDLDRRSCYVHVENKRIEFHYLEVACVNGRADKELYYLHELPALDLFSTVDPKTTDVSFNPRGVTISVLKTSKVFWKTLAIDPQTKSKLRRPWLTVDHDRNEDDDDDDEEKEVPNSETLFHFDPHDPKHNQSGYAGLQPDDSDPEGSSCSEDSGESAQMDLPRRRKRPVKDCGGSDEEWDFALSLEGNYFQ